MSRTLCCQGMIFEEATHPEPFRMPWHSHDNAHMVLLFSGGIENTTCRGRGSETTLASVSDLLFVPAGETHASHYQGRVHGFYVHFRPAWWEQMQQHLARLNTTRPYQNCSAARLAQRLYSEFQQQDNLTGLMLETLTVELLVTMARTELIPGAGANRFPHWLKEIQAYLHAHFTESFTLEDLARTAGVHPGHLARGFRRQFHCTIGEYVRRLRIEHACRLLTDPHEDQSLAQVAHTLGFADQSHFCKTFKRLTGQTPTEARNNKGVQVTLVPETFA